jgi:hypothetical protein
MDEKDKEIARLQSKIDSLHLECRKYRIALNRVATPALWGCKPGFHAEIARRALLIGVEIEPLPEEARL